MAKASRNRSSRASRVEQTTAGFDIELMAPLPVEQTTAGAQEPADAPADALSARRELSNMRAIRVRTALARWQCPVCARTTPRVYKTDGDVRYVQCVCGMTGAIVVRDPANETRPS